MKRQLKKPKFWFTDSAEAEKQTENNTSSTENVLFVIDNVMRQKNHCSRQQPKKYTQAKLKIIEMDLLFTIENALKKNFKKWYI